MHKWLACGLALILSVVSGGAAGIPSATGDYGASRISCLLADDIPKSEDFLWVVAWLGAGSGEWQLKSGSSFLCEPLAICRTLNAPKPGMMDRFESVSFATSDAEALRKYLGAHDVTVPDAVTVESNGDRSFMVLDPEGNKVGFTQAGTHPPAPPANVSDRLSAHIMHTGYVVRNRAALDHFYGVCSGFTPLLAGWKSGPDKVDWVMMQAPDGSGLDRVHGVSAGRVTSLAQLGSANHLLRRGWSSVAELPQRQLEGRGWKLPAAGKNPQVLCVDGKMQLDLNDPDGARVEFMEFLPVASPCCSPYTGKRSHSASSSW